jgi:hypothetical protein
MADEQGDVLVRTWCCVGLFCLLVATTSAQEPQAKTAPSDEVVQLKALVYVLQDKLARVERELGAEKARRAELEIAELERARETLDPSVKRVLGLPVPDAPVEKKPAPQTPPK